MKKLQVLAAITLLAAGLFSSCKKAATTSSTPTTTYYMTASIANDNPPSWVASSSTGSNPQPLGLGNITVTGTNTDGESIVITFPNNVAVGYYTMYTSPTYISANYTLSSNSYYVGQSGSMNITAISSTSVSGTFTFSALNSSNSTSVSITNGKFKVKLN